MAVDPPFRTATAEPVTVARPLTGQGLATDLIAIVAALTQLLLWGENQRLGTKDSADHESLSRNTLFKLIEEMHFRNCVGISATES